jgi:hypothetical protein
MTGRVCGSRQRALSQSVIVQGWIASSFATRLSYEDPTIDTRVSGVGPACEGRALSPADSMCTRYSLRKGDYLYDVEIYEDPTPGTAVRFYAQVLNMARLESGRAVVFGPEVQDQVGRTRDEAFSYIDGAVDAWVKDQTHLETPINAAAGGLETPPSAPCRPD